MLVEDIKEINNLDDWRTRVGDFIQGYSSARSLLLVTENKAHKEILTEVIHEVLPNTTDYQSNVMWVGADEEKINTDQIRSIYGFLGKTSYNKLSRIIIIENVDKLNLHSGNALLKILEDCAVDAYFILLCANLNLVISTIRSRCIRIILPRTAIVNIDHSFEADFSQVMLRYKIDVRASYEFLDKYFFKDTSENNWTGFRTCVYRFIEDLIKDQSEQLEEKVIADFSAIYSLLDNASKCNLSLYNSALLILQKLKGRDVR
jgi:hypothetical protein